jgi:hypothetical protein
VKRRIRLASRPFPADERLPAPPRPAGRVLDARLHLLDRQVHDVDGTPVVVVDDLEVRGADGDAQPTGAQDAVVTSLLSGPVLGTRVFGGHPPPSRWHRVPWSDVTEVGVVVRLGVRGDALDVSWTERWVRDHVVGRIPGGRHDPG